MKDQVVWIVISWPRKTRSEGLKKRGPDYSRTSLISDHPNCQALLGPLYTNEPGLNTDSGQYSVDWVLLSHELGLGEFWVDFHFPTTCTWERAPIRKESNVQTSPGQMGQCLHEETEVISILLAGSIRVSRSVTRQGGLTRLDYCFYLNAYKHLTAKAKRVTRCGDSTRAKKQPGLV